MAIYLGYENYKVTKQNRDIMKSKIDAINNHQAFHMTIF